jgi:micrococcal nuclease
MPRKEDETGSVFMALKKILSLLLLKRYNIIGFWGWSRRFTLSIIVCLIVWVIQGSGACYAEAEAFNARVIRIIDGDTLEIQKGMKLRRVRIWGIDTPEWDQPYASQACGFTRRLLEGCDVLVLPIDVDSFGRLVAMIMVNGRNVSEELVRSGLAWVHIYYCKKPICDDWRTLQERAKFQHLGLWGDARPIAPWLWKKHTH